MRRPDDSGGRKAPQPHARRPGRRRRRHARDDAHTENPAMIAAGGNLPALAPHPMGTDFSQLRPVAPSAGRPRQMMARAEAVEVREKRVMIFSRTARTNGHPRTFVKPQPAAGHTRKFSSARPLAHAHARNIARSIHPASREPSRHLPRAPSRHSQPLGTCSVQRTTRGDAIKLRGLDNPAGAHTGGRVLNTQTHLSSAYRTRPHHAGSAAFVICPERPGAVL